MKNKKNPIVIICMCIILYIITITFAASFVAARNIKINRNYVDFSNGWQTRDGEVVQLTNLPESCVIWKEIPSVGADAILSFNARNVDVDLYVDDVCLYKTKKTDDAFLRGIFGKTAGSAFVDVPILKEYSGKTLYIDIKNPYSNGSSCKIVHMYFGDGVPIIKHDASTQLGSFCFSMLVVFVGVTCLVLYIPLGKRKIVDSSMLYLGLAAFAFGMSMITDSKMLHLIVGFETLYYAVSQMFMIIIPIPLLLYFDKLYGDLNRKIIYVLCILDIVDFTAVAVLNAVGVFDYHDNAFCILLILALTIFYIGIITFHKMLKHDNSNLFHNVGVIVIIVAAALDMFMTRVDMFVETSFFTRFGVAGFACMEFTQVLWKHMDNYQKGMQAQLVSRLAYHDGLTDMLNRLSFMEDMDRMEEEPPENLLIAMFDINDLKYVNDNFGHADGDDLIINVANALRKSFSGIGKCYRTGGDEFVFICLCEDAERKYKQACLAMQEQIRETGEYSKYPVSVASGYALKTPQCSEINAVWKCADERMYENKRQMKEAGIISASTT